MPKRLGLVLVTSRDLTGEPLTLRRLLVIYFPLALSWVMMAAEMPICSGFVNRLPDNRVQIAALLVLTSIALFIESPVIDLLATSTTLARSLQNFSAIRKFSVILLVSAGVVHFLVAVTPLFDWVMLGLLGQKKEVADAVRIPMLTMVLWSPAIGWRRHVQGLLIRNGSTSPIGAGTAVRVTTILVTCFIGYSLHRLPGAEVAAIALTTSVIAEAVFIQVAGKRLMNNHVWPETDSAPLRLRDLAAFHGPLTFSTMVTIASMPLIIRALAQAPDNLLAMNSWQVCLTLAFLLRTITFALPEVVIANWNSGSNSWLLVRFCTGVGLGLSLLIGVMCATGADVWFFANVTHADPQVTSGAHKAFLMCLLLPTLSAMTSYVRGVMTAEQVTSSRLYATVWSVLSLLALLALGVSNKWPGVVTAAVAVTGSQFAEMAVLLGYVRARIGLRAFLPQS